VDPNTRHPTRGAGDFCLLTDTPIDEVASHLGAQGVAIIEGPIRRTGATGPIQSVYFYDPDENLVEVSDRLDGAA
jgi:catechol 2,3-dioxygenase-like lactoylglutathione lyase family enzyme